MKIINAGGDGGHQLQIALKSLQDVKWRDKTILDIGCSNGYVTSKILEKTGAKKIIGIEIDELRVKKAKELEKKLASDRLEFYHGNATDLSQFPDEQFDGIFSNMVFQQLKDKVKEVLKEIHRILKKGGIAVINFNQEKSEVVVEIQKLLLQKEVEKSKDIDKESMMKLSEESGFKVIKADSDYDIYYHQSVDQLIGDPKKASIAVKNQNYSDEELRVFWQKLRKTFEARKTLNGYPEQWNIVYLKLIKIR
ncbi:MAG: methyltransferase domain-containing protein [Candidatus Berkelbacteria bacterium]|nr:methyltransferase domain-containing protein [Candidatus Berkelbacteria bacterium]